MRFVLVSGWRMQATHGMWPLSEASLFVIAAFAHAGVFWGEDFVRFVNQTHRTCGIVREEYL